MNDPKSGFINNQNLILSTDFYELTMGAAYYQYNLDNNIKEKDDIAVFDLFIRTYPKNRNYLIFAGLEQVIHYLQNARFTEKTIEFLRKKEVFNKIDSSFFDDYLPNFKFKLDIWAMREGNFFFPNEPIMKVQGPMFHAQLAETYISGLSLNSFRILQRVKQLHDVLPVPAFPEHLPTFPAFPVPSGIYLLRQLFPYAFLCDGFKLPVA